MPVEQRSTGRAQRRRARYGDLGGPQPLPVRKADALFAFLADMTPLGQVLTLGAMVGGALIVSYVWFLGLMLVGLQ